MRGKDRELTDIASSLITTMKLFSKKKINNKLSPTKWIGDDK